MSHDYYSEGDFIHYTNPGPNAIAAGEFVLNAGGTVILGLATRAIPVNASCAIFRQPGGIVNVDKLPADNFVAGTPVNLVVASKLVSTGAGLALGRSVISSGVGATKALIALGI
jgi:predicted RecA/RadA family phage recombinase